MSFPLSPDFAHLSQFPCPIGLCEELTHWKICHKSLEGIIYILARRETGPHPGWGGWRRRPAGLALRLARRREPRTRHRLLYAAGLSRGGVHPTSA